MTDKDCYLRSGSGGSPNAADQQAHHRHRPHLLVIVWHVLADGATYTELGPDYLARNDHPDRRRRHLVRQLEQLGYTVALSPPPDAPDARVQETP